MRSNVGATYSIGKGGKEEETPPERPSNGPEE